MLEVCVDNVQAALAAVRAGAQRIELCAALDVGGVTPCRALIDSVRARVACPLVILIRPRCGNFLYTDLETEQCLASMREAIDCGANAIAVGGLDASSQPAYEFLKSVCEVATTSGAVELVMHRAFDFVFDQTAALEQLISLGFKRVLTSGGVKGFAQQQCAQLKRLNQQARGRIEIMPGGGVSASNVLTIFKTTGCRTIHGSFRMPPAHAAEHTAFGTQIQVDASAVASARRTIDDYLCLLRCKARSQEGWPPTKNHP